MEHQHLTQPLSQKKWTKITHLKLEVFYIKNDQQTETGIMLVSEGPGVSLLTVSKSDW